MGGWNTRGGCLGFRWGVRGWCGGIKYCGRYSRMWGFERVFNVPVGRGVSGGRCRGLASYRGSGAAKHLYDHGSAAGRAERGQPGRGGVV